MACLLALAIGLASYAALPAATAGPPPKKDPGGPKNTTTTTAPRQATQLVVAPPVYYGPDTPGAGAWMPNVVPCLNYDGCSDYGYYGVDWDGGTAMTARLTTRDRLGVSFVYVEMSADNGASCLSRTDRDGYAWCLTPDHGVATTVHARFDGNATHEPSEGRF